MYVTTRTTKHCLAAAKLAAYRYPPNPFQRRRREGRKERKLKRRRGT